MYLSRFSFRCKNHSGDFRWSLLYKCFFVRYSQTDKNCIKHLTRFFKFTVVCIPSLTYAEQIFFHGLNVHVGTVALWEFGTTLTPAVIVLADELTLWIAGNIAQSCLNKMFLQILRQDDLKTWRQQSIMLLNEKECSSQAASPTYETNKQIMKKETIWLFKDNLHICLASALSYISFLKN